MRKSMLAAGLAVVAAVAATVVGMTVASAANSAPIQRFTFLSTNDQTGFTVVIAQGPIHARGRDVSLSTSVDRLVFPKGNLRIHHHRIGKGVNTFDPVTCYGTYREHGTYRVVRGTGSYRGTAGHGTYHVHLRTVGRRAVTGSCSMHKPPRIFMVVLNAAGPLHR